MGCKSRFQNKTKPRPQTAAKRTEERGAKAEPAPLDWWLEEPLLEGDGGAVADADAVVCAAGRVEVTTGAVEDGVNEAVPSSTVMYIP